MIRWGTSFGENLICPRGSCQALPAAIRPQHSTPADKPQISQIYIAKSIQRLTSNENMLVLILLCTLAMTVDTMLGN